MSKIEPKIEPNSDPLLAASRAERAYRTLRGEILHGVLMPGERLRPSDLQDKFGLGLTPIREALTRLSVEGMIDGETHRGARVRGASAAELADVMATRRAIERLCLTQALAEGDAAWEAQIVATYHVLSRTLLPEDGEDRAALVAWERHHRAFHHALVAACGSPWLMRFWDTLVDHSERYRKTRMLRRRAENLAAPAIDREHAALMQAALARDVGRVTDLMDAHLARTERAVAAALAPTA